VLKRRTVLNEHIGVQVEKGHQKTVPSITLAHKRGFRTAIFDQSSLIWQLSGEKNNTGALG